MPVTSSPEAPAHRCGAPQAVNCPHAKPGRECWYPHCDCFSTAPPPAAALTDPAHPLTGDPR